MLSNPNLMSRFWSIELQETAVELRDQQSVGNLCQSSVGGIDTVLDWTFVLDKSLLSVLKVQVVKIEISHSKNDLLLRSQIVSSDGCIFLHKVHLIHNTIVKGTWLRPDVSD